LLMSKVCLILKTKLIIDKKAIELNAAKLIHAAGT